MLDVSSQWEAEMIELFTALVICVMGLCMFAISAIYCALWGYIAALVVSLTMAGGVPWYAWGVVLGLAFGIDVYYKRLFGKPYLWTKTPHLRMIGFGILSGIAYAALIKHSPNFLFFEEAGWAFVAINMLCGTVAGAAGIAELLDKNLGSQKNAAQ